MADSPALTWSEIAARLAPWRNYWVGTTGAGGAPHAVPVWGVVVDGTWYLYTEPDTVKARNLANDPRVVVHLESGDDVLLVRGRMEPVGEPDDRRRVVAAFNAKYTEPGDLEYLPDPGQLVLALRPESALTWDLDGFDDTQRRWRAPDAGRDR